MHCNIVCNGPDFLFDTAHSHESVQFLHHVFHGYLLRSFLSRYVIPAEHIVFRIAGVVPFYGLVEEIAHFACVSEGVRTFEVHFVEDAGKHFIRLGIQSECGVLIVAGEHTAEYFFKLTRLIVREFYGYVESGRSARVDSDEFPHFLGVAGHYADEFAFAVLRNVEQGVHGIGSVSSSLVTAGKSIGLINEEDSSHSLVHVFLDIGFRISQELADEILAGYFHKLSCWQGSYGVEHLPELACKGGLSGAGVAGEYIMVPQQLAGDAVFLLFLDIPDDGFDFVFHALKAHKLVKFGQDFLFRLGCKTAGIIYIRLTYAFARAHCRLDRQVLCSFFRKMSVHIAHFLLSHTPGKMALEFLDGSVFHPELVFFPQH